MDISKEITFLTPSRIINNEMLNDFENVIKKHYSLLQKPYPLHLIKDDSPIDFKNKIKKILEKHNSNHIFIGENIKTNAAEAFDLLMRNVNTPYLNYVLTDVLAIDNIDYITPSIMAMNDDKNIMQICVGGTFLEKGSDKFVEIENNNLYINVKRKIQLFPKSYNGQTVWTCDVDIEKFSDFYFVMAFWNQVLRTSMCKRFSEVTRSKYNPKQHTIETWIIKAHREFEVPGYDFPKKWTEGYEWLSEYKMGFLNLKTYLYPIGRQPLNYKDFEKFHENKQILEQNLI